MSDLITPRLAYPFRIEGGRAVQVEQDSEDDVRSAVEVLMRTRFGQRRDLPSYGTPDLTFTMGLQEEDLEVIRDLITQWEPRAEVEFTIVGEGTKEQTVEIQVRSA